MFGTVETGQNENFRETKLMADDASRHRTDQSSSSDRKNFAVDTKRAAAGGLIAALLIFFGTFGVGQVSNVEAFTLIQAMLPSTRFLCSAVMTASATILALMLTLLSFSHQAEQTLRPTHYQRIKQVARLDSIVFIAATFLLVFINIPVQESREVLRGWYSVLYFALLVYSARVGGLLISIVLMLYNATGDLIIVAHPHKEHSHLTMSEENL